MLKAFGVKGLYIYEYTIIVFWRVTIFRLQVIETEEGGSTFLQKLAPIDKTTRRHKSEDHNRNTYHRRNGDFTEM